MSQRTMRRLGGLAAALLLLVALWEIAGAAPDAGTTVQVVFVGQEGQEPDDAAARAQQAAVARALQWWERNDGEDRDLRLVTPARLTVAPGVDPYRSWGWLPNYPLPADVVLYVVAGDGRWPSLPNGLLAANIGRQVAVMDYYWTRGLPLAPELSAWEAFVASRLGHALYDIPLLVYEFPNCHSDVSCEPLVAYPAEEPGCWTRLFLAREDCTTLPGPRSDSPAELLSRERPALWVPIAR